MAIGWPAKELYVLLDKVQDQLYNLIVPLTLCSRQLDIIKNQLVRLSYMYITMYGVKQLFFR